MKTNLVWLAAVGLGAAMVFNSCKKDDDDNDTTPVAKEHVADNSTFSNWSSWTLNETRMGADPSLGPMAHGGQDTTFTRKIYIKDNAKLVNGSYPEGTVIVKHSENGDGSRKEYTGMVKRGASFNSDKGGWEYFMLEANGNIAKDTTGMEMRGADLMNGMCQGCHTGAKSLDYVFTAK